MIVSVYDFIIHVYTCTHIHCDAFSCLPFPLGPWMQTPPIPMPDKDFANANWDSHSASFSGCVALFGFRLLETSHKILYLFFQATNTLKIL